MTEFRKYIPLFLFGDENMIDIDKMVDGYYNGSQFYPGGGYKTSDWIDVSNFDFPSVFNLKWTNSSTTANLKVIRFGANKNYLGDWTTIYPYSDPDGDDRSAFVTEPAAEQYITNTTFNNSTTIYSAVAGGLKSITAKGICTQASTPAPDAPVDIVCNNGAIKFSPQMCDVNEQTVSVGYYISSAGIVTASPYNWFYQDYIKVKPNTSYTLSISVPVYFISISEYSTTSDSGFIVRKAGSSGNQNLLTITTEANTNFIRFGSNLDSSEVTMEEVLGIDWMLNQGSSALPYEPYKGSVYVDGTQEQLSIGANDTASVENLLSVGAYYDEQEILSGIVTRRIGILILDGTESYGTSSAYGAAFYIRNAANTWSANRNETVICSHFIGRSTASQVQPVDTCFFNSSGHFYFRVPDNSDPAAFKSWVAAQYANGTPVMIVYNKLSSAETTETVAGQEINLADGTNYVSSTGSATPLSFDANYAIKGEDVAYLRVTMVNTTTNLEMYKTYEYSHSTSIINPDTLRQGVYSSTGEFDATNISFLTTDFIPVTNGEYEIDWVRYGYGNLPVRVTAFDENKQFKSQTMVGENPDSSATYTISDNTVKYIAISYPKNLSRVYRAYKK